MTDRLPKDTLRLGLPSGSLQQSTIELFGRAGYRVNIAERSVFPRIDDDKLSAVFFRARKSAATSSTTSSTAASPATTTSSRTATKKTWSKSAS